MRFKILVAPRLPPLPLLPLLDDALLPRTRCLKAVCLIFSILNEARKASFLLHVRDVPVRRVCLRGNESRSTPIEQQLKRIVLLRTTKTSTDDVAGSPTGHAEYLSLSPGP